jgi:hypothetical protein
MKNTGHQAADQSAWIFKAQLPHCQIWEQTLTRAIAEVYIADSYSRPHLQLKHKPHLVSTLGVVADAHTR